MAKKNDLRQLGDVIGATENGIRDCLSSIQKLSKVKTVSPKLSGVDVPKIRELQRIGSQLDTTEYVLKSQEAEISKAQDSLAKSVIDLDEFKKTIKVCPTCDRAL